MGLTPNLASLQEALLKNPRLMRRVWTKYPALLDRFADQAQQLLEGEAEFETTRGEPTAEDRERRLRRAMSAMAEAMDDAKNPNLALLLRSEQFPALRNFLLEREGADPAALPNASSLLKAIGVWILRRKDDRPRPERLLELAQALRRNGQANLARRLLLHRLWRGGDCPPEFFLKTRAELALCTSMATDLPPGPRLDAADDLLRASPPAFPPDQKPGPGELAQSLRCFAWISRRRWEFNHRRRDLKLAGRYYEQAFKLAPDKSDQLRSAVDAATHLDLLASLDEGADSRDEAQATRARADELRLRALEDALADSAEPPPISQKEGPPPEIAADPLQLYPWLLDVAQLQLGLQRWAKTLDQGRDEIDVETAKKLDWFEGLRNPMRRLVEARQLAESTEKEPQERLPAWIQSRKVQELAARTKLWEVGEGYVRALVDPKSGDRAAIGRSISLGKVGLGLSGGGFRASLFHLGVLASLAEWDLLRQLEVVSCVSGGSIVGAQFYLELRHLLESRKDRDITRDDYVGLVRELIHEFLAGVQKNIRTRVVVDPWANLRMLLTHYTRSARAGDLLGKHLFQRIGDVEEGVSVARRGPWLLADLRVLPLADNEDDAGEGGGGGFNPARDNWRREHKVPILLLNATSLNTGHNWQFGATWMGESPAAIDPNVDSNNRLRRMNLETEAPPPHDHFRLGHAVAASASVPGLFEPSTLPGLYDKKLVRLVDGGVFDNQGIAGLLEQECRILLVSDASGQMSAQDRPGGGFLGSTMRTNTILMDRVRQTQFRDLRARQQADQLDELTYVHLKRDLEADPVNWLGCDDPKPPERSGDLPAYGIPKPTQELLAGIRTDLDSFCDAEAYALMYSGYRMMTVECERMARPGGSTLLADSPGSRRPGTANGKEDADDDVAIAVDWPFLCVEERVTDETAPGFGRLAAILGIGSQGAFKIWRLWRRGRPLAKWAAGALALLPLAWAAWLYARWLVDVDPRATLGVSQLALGLAPLTLLVVLLVPPFRRLLARVVRLVLFGVLGMVTAWIQLLVFDPLYLRYGREPAGFARRLLEEARRTLDRAGKPPDPDKLDEAERQVEKARAILNRLLRPKTAGNTRSIDSPWLSRVAEARALALLERIRSYRGEQAEDRKQPQAADLLSAVASELVGAADEMAAEEEASRGARRSWLKDRQATLRRRKAYVERLAGSWRADAAGAREDEEGGSRSSASAAGS